MQGLFENVVGPVGLILAGIGIVLLVGLWVTKDKDPDDTSTGKVTAPTAEDTQKPADPPAQQPPPPPPPPKEEPAKEDPPQQQPAQQPPAQQPPPAPPPASEEALAMRAHRAMINRAGGDQGMMVVAYYLDGLTDSQSMQPVEMKVPVSPGRIRATVEHLIAAPTDVRLQAPFPAGTTVLGANLKQGVAIVDLSQEAAGVRGSAASSAIQHMLVYTLTEIDGVNAVELRIDGRPAQLDQLLWDKPVSRADLGAYAVAPLIQYEGP